LARAGVPTHGIADGEGLTFRITPAGAKFWVLRYRVDGRQRSLTLGQYPAMTLTAARTRARVERGLVASGADGVAQRRPAKEEAMKAPLFAEIAEDYYTRSASSLADRSRDELRRYLDNDLLPGLGRKKAREIASVDVVAMVERIAERSDSVARRAFQIASVI